jgi:DNA-binding NarL/FixJ family response regulator
MKKAKQFDVAMADDHTLLRDALGHLIDTYEGFRVIGYADNGKELIDLIEAGSRPNIVLLDIGMPVMDGYEVCKILKDKHPEIKIIILSMFDGEIGFLRLLQLGVKGFLKKDIYPDELHVAINAVAADGYYYSNATTGKLAAFFHNAQLNNQAIEKSMLTEQDIAFLKLVSTDKTYKEIATIMELTPRTIDSYRDMLFEKLNVKSRVGLAVYAIKNGIVNF